MLKRIALLLIFAILLGLSACDTKDPEIKISEVNAGGSEKVTLEILSAKKTQDNGTVLEIRWNNGTPYDILYGEFFGIQRLEGETWVAVPMKENTAFNAIGYSLPSKSSVTKDYALDWAYDVSNGGTYRFTTDCTIYDTNYGTECQLWAEFTVAGDPVSLDENPLYIIRTDGYHEGRKYPKAALISSKEALDSYYEESREFYCLDGTGTDNDFYSITRQFNEDFFEKNDLLMVLLEENSGSITHEVWSLTCEDAVLSIRIQRHVPEAITMDIAQWHILVPVEKALGTKSIKVYLNENLACEVDAVAPNISWAVSEFKEPPKLEVVHDGGQFEAFHGGYTWSHATGDGTWTTICADALHPLQMKAHLQPVSCGNNQVRLVFEQDPSTVSVRCWPDDQWENTDSQSEAADMWNRVLNLNQGGWIYEVTATWNEDNYYGTATYVFYMAPAMLLHGHLYSSNPQTVDEPVTFWCGNTVATLHLAGESFSFMGGNAIALSDILVNLAYDPEMICRCMAEYTADTETGKGYQINLTQGFVRCEKGQAALTREQADALRAIVEWAEHETRER